MSRVAPKIKCSAEVRAELERRAASRTEEARVVERARMILGCLDGAPVQEVAAKCQTRANTVIKWRNRFMAQGLLGLSDEPRPGAPKTYDENFRQRVLAILDLPPPKGQAVWDGPAVAKALDSSVYAVWRVLHLSATTTILVRQYRQRICGKGGGYCRLVFESARECLGYQRR